LKIPDKQQLLEIEPVSERLERIYSFMEGEISVLQVEKRIRGRVKRQMEKTQREYYLNEQMKAIQKELGDEKFVAVGVSLDKVEGFNRRSGGLEAFLKAAGTNHPVALGNDEVAQAYSVHSVPSIVLIDADGNLVKRVEDPANLLKEIKAVLMP